uniref:Uncharacterized protein n=1 Tax=Scleropages formosus TaxID=113540 RepID=A0A8C9V015_SCLFO
MSPGKPSCTLRRQTGVCSHHAFSTRRNSYKPVHLLSSLVKQQGGGLLGPLPHLSPFKNLPAHTLLPPLQNRKLIGEYLRT